MVLINKAETYSFNKNHYIKKQLQAQKMQQRVHIMAKDGLAIWEVRRHKKEKLELKSKLPTSAGHFFMPIGWRWTDTKHSREKKKQTK